MLIPYNPTENFQRSFILSIFSVTLVFQRTCQCHILVGIYMRWIIIIVCYHKILSLLLSTTSLINLDLSHAIRYLHFKDHV